MSHDACLSMLKDLIETFRDGERGFALATRDNREPGVEEVLRDGEEWCRSAGMELQEQARRLGGAAEENSTARPPVYRGWVSFKAVPISRDTKLILEECERGADYARNRYEAAMDLELPESARTLIESHYQRLIVIQGRLRVLRNRYPATEMPRATGHRFDDRSR